MENLKKDKIVFFIKLGITLLFSVVIIFFISLFSYSGGNELGLYNGVKVTNNNIACVSDEFGYKSFAKLDDEDFKVLQITDMHIGNGFMSRNADKKAFDAVQKLVSATHPDLIILTGDVVYPVPFQSGSRNNLLALKAVGEFMEGLEIPWTMIFGNHDCEKYSTHTKMQLCNYLETLNYCIFDTNDVGIPGLGNTFINIYNTTNTLNTSLALFDSGGAINNVQLLGYQNISPEQTAWYETEIRRFAKDEEIKPSLAFMHIPGTEFKDAWAECKKGSTEIVHHFGSVGETGGKISTAKQDSTLWAKMQELGSTKGIFVGHDHLNDFSITYKGIRLTFSKSIDYIAYPNIANKTSQRGATLISIDNSANFEVEQIVLENIEG